MSAFKDIKDFDTSAKYVALLKKATKEVNAKIGIEFIYCEHYAFADAPKKYMPVVFMDYAPNIRRYLIDKKFYTAHGQVFLTPDDKLHFAVEKGKIKTIPLKKSLITLSPQLKEVDIDPNEVEDTPPVPLVPAPARPKAALPTSSASVALPLDANTQVKAVEDFINALNKSATTISAARKKKAIDAAQALLKKNDPAGAMKTLNALIETVVYPGIPDWVLRPATRKYEMELLTEKFQGLINLILYKRQSPGNANKWATELAAISALCTGPTNFDTEMVYAFREADPEKVKTTFKKWDALLAKYKTYAEALKDTWEKDQEDRFRQETADNNKSHNASVVASYGRDAVLSMAQMAEVQAMNYKTKPGKEQDPVAQGDWHKKLDIAELAGIYGYSTADYTAINNLYRNDPKTDAEKKALEKDHPKFKDIVKATIAGLEKLPPYKGPTLVRCTKGLWPETIEEITKTGLRTEKSFTSTGKQKAAGFGDMEMLIDGVITGKDITMFSLHQMEGEVLFPPHRQFQFVKAEVPGPDNTMITITDHKDFGTYVTKDTKIAKVWFTEKA